MLVGGRVVRSAVGRIAAGPAQDAAEEAASNPDEDVHGPDGLESPFGQSQDPTAAEQSPDSPLSEPEDREKNDDEARGDENL
jgi:hypothetical protein